MDLQSHSDITYLLQKELHIPANSVKLQMISDPGSSQSRVYLYRNNNQLIAIKQSTISHGYRPDLLLEATKRDVIIPYLKTNVARIFWRGCHNNKQYMIYECIGQNSLHQQILLRNLSSQDIFSVWNDMLNKILNMWDKSRQPVDLNTTYARDYTLRFERIEEYLHKFFDKLSLNLSNVLSAPVRVNGKLYPPLSSLLSELKEYDEPKFTVTCHGDPQPSNIIVNQDTLHWQLIDWEWSATNHDWRMMSAHLVGWWLTRTVKFSSRPTLKYVNSEIIINYELAADEENKLIALSTIGEIDKRFNLLSDGLSCKQFKKFLALLIIGETRFLSIWHRENHLPYHIAKALEVYYNQDECLLECNHE